MLVGRSRAMHDLKARIARVAATSFTVLIEGESGAGKELVAHELHQGSSRRRGPFVAVNCAALVETLLEAELFGIEERTATGVRGRRGKFELADGGTLFLDEVADLSPTAQAKLLRVLQDMSVERVGANQGRAVDTRVIAATNRALASQVQAGAFRSDLFYRLAGVEIQVPPLRARREDVPQLAEHILARHRATRPLRLSAGANDALMAYDWPGNVRQLERVLERAVALAAGPAIEIGDLPDEVAAPYQNVLATFPDRDESLRAWSSRYVRLVLDRCNGNKRRACGVLDISFHTLQAYLGYRSNRRESVAEQAPAEPARPMASTG
jgi:transcriptional regulator with PAS, ATPase and Fis domain